MLFGARIFKEYRMSLSPVKHLQSSYGSKKSNCCSPHLLHRSLCYLGFTVMLSIQHLYEQWAPWDKFTLLSAIEQEPCYSIFFPTKWHPGPLLEVCWEHCSAVIIIAKMCNRSTSIWKWRRNILLLNKWLSIYISAAI